MSVAEAVSIPSLTFSVNDVVPTVAPQDMFILAVTVPFVFTILDIVTPFVVADIPPLTLTLSNTIGSSVSAMVAIVVFNDPLPADREILADEIVGTLLATGIKT